MTDTAVQTWADAMLAAALLAVDPELGGAAVRAGPGPVRDAWVAGLRGLHSEGTSWKRLPPGIGDDRLIGGLDLAAMLTAHSPLIPAKAGTQTFGRSDIQDEPSRPIDPGASQKSWVPAFVGMSGNGGLHPPEGPLAEADGGVLIAPMAERMEGGVAARLASALDEGAVRIERDGVSERTPTRFVLVALDEGLEDERPPEALLERLAFRLDLDGVGWRDAQPIAATPDDIAEARQALIRVAAPGEAAIHAVCAAAEALGVASLRAPRLTLRAAAALAALEGRDAIEADDLSTAARLVLSPRATRLPPQPVPEDNPAEAEPDPAEAAHDTESHEREPDVLDDLVLEAARAALPEGLEALWAASGRMVRGAPHRSGPTGARLPKAKRGRRIGSRPGRPDGAASLDLVETLKAATPWQRLRGLGPDQPRGSLRLRRDDFRVRRFEQRAESTVIFVVDASGSAALQRLAETKGAVELLLAEAYVRRTQVALIAFRKEAAELLLPPTRSLARARRELAALAGGGTTPLASGLETAAALALGERAKGRTPLLVVMTDGRGNIALDGGAFRTRAEQDALTACRRIRAAGVSAALIDVSPRPRGEGARLAEAMGATFAALPYVEAERVRDLVKALEV